MLIGGGRMGYYLGPAAAGDRHGREDHDRTRSGCEELRQLLPEATILHGDGTDQRLLQEEGIEHMEPLRR